MPIEIKELHIKVTVSGNPQLAYNKDTLNNQDLFVLKQQLIDECTERIIEKLKEREER